MKIKNVAKEVQARIDALTEQKTGEIVKIKDKLAQLRADLEAIQGRAKAATEALDADAYMKEQTAAQTNAMVVSILFMPKNYIVESRVPIPEATLPFSSSLKIMNCGFSSVQGVQGPAFSPFGLPNAAKLVQHVIICSARS